LTDKRSYNQWTEYIWDAYGSISQLLIFNAVLLHMDRQKNRTNLMCVNAILQQIKRKYCSRDGAMDQPEEN
jgi:hypothetical protein